MESYWLFDVILAACQCPLGFERILVLKAAVVAMAFGLVYRFLMGSGVNALGRATNSKRYVLASGQKPATIRAGMLAAASPRTHARHRDGPTRPDLARSRADLGPRQ